MTIRKILSAFALTSSLALSVSGCATTEGAEPEESATPIRRAPKENKAVAKVRSQASFDLNCDGAALTVSLLDNEPGMLGSSFATYGVRGCQKQATYKASCGMGTCAILKN